MIAIHASVFAVLCFAPKGSSAAVVHVVDTLSGAVLGGSICTLQSVVRRRCHSMRSPANRARSVSQDYVSASSSANSSAPACHSGDGADSASDVDDDEALDIVRHLSRAVRNQAAPHQDARHDHTEALPAPGGKHRGRQDSGAIVRPTTPVTHAGGVGAGSSDDSVTADRDAQPVRAVVQHNGSLTTAAGAAMFASFRPQVFVLLLLVNVCPVLYPLVMSKGQRESTVLVTLPACFGAASHVLHAARQCRSWVWWQLGCGRYQPRAAQHTARVRGLQHTLHLNTWSLTKWSAFIHHASMLARVVFWALLLTPVAVAVLSGVALARARGEEGSSDTMMESHRRWVLFALAAHGEVYLFVELCVCVCACCLAVLMATCLPQLLLLRIPAVCSV